MKNDIRTKLTPPQLAARWGVSPTKILAWIRSGELQAFDAATRRGGRPRYLIAEEAVEAFERRRRVINLTHSSRRGRKKRSNPEIIEFF